jgi:hypothetical protein
MHFLWPGGHMRIRSLWLIAAMLFSPISYAEPCTGKDELRFLFRKIELKEAFSIFADFSGYKLVMDQSIAWSGPMAFECTSWRKVAQELATEHGLRLEIKNKTIYVSR